MSTISENSSEAHVSHVKYRPDIDGLRAIAVLIVVIYHAFPELLPGGFVGVDIFFIISGFLISTILFQSIESKSFSVFDFYGRRIRRIFPSLSLVLLAVGVFGWFSLRTDEFEQLGKHIAAGAGFVSNIVLWQESGYFDAAAETKPLLHLWSLGIEEQFYFFFPLLLLIAKRLRWNLFVVTATIAAMSFLWSIVQYNRDNTALFYSPQTRFWELMLGSLLAYAVLHKDNVFVRRLQARNGTAFIGVIFVVLAVVTAAVSDVYPGPWALFPTIGASLLILAGATTWFNRTILSNKLMVGIGLISYPLYLWHWPLLTYARILEGRTPSSLARFGCVVASVVLAYGTYKLVERPLRFNKRIRMVTVGLATSVLVVGVSGGVVVSKNGFENRSINLQPVKFAGDIGHEEFHQYIESRFFPCTPQSVLDNAETWEGYVRCAQSRNDIPVDTVILGDSHAEHLFIGLAESLPNKNVVFYSREGMAILRSDAFKVMFDAIRDNPNIKNVIVSHLWSLRKVPAKDLKKAVERIRSWGKNVYITDDTPDLLFFPDVCKFNGQCTEDAGSFGGRYNSYIADLNSIVESVPGVQLIKTSEILCDQEVCRMGQDGVLFFRDPHHLNIPGSQYVGAEIVQRHPELAQ